MFAFAPFVAYVALYILNIDFITVIQLTSYFGIILLFIFKPKGTPIKLPTYLRFYLLFIIYVFIRDLVGLGRDFKIIYLFKNDLIGAFNFMLIIENLVIKRGHYKFILRISKYTLVVAVIIILVQQAFSPHIFMNPDFLSEEFLKSDNDNRLYSIYSWIGNLQAVGFGFVPIYLLIIEDTDKKKKKIILWLLMGLTFALLTKARWIMLNTFLVFVILFINHRAKTIRFFKLLLALPLIIYISFSGLKVVGIDVQGIVNERILEKDKKSMNETTAGTRLLAFKVFDRLFWESPYYGHGSYAYGMGGMGKQNYQMSKILKGKSSQIHVGYLALVFRYGFVGGFFFLASIFLLLKKLYSNAKLTGRWAPFLGIMGIALANLTLVHFSLMQMGFLIVLYANEYYLNSMALQKREI